MASPYWLILRTFTILGMLAVAVMGLHAQNTPGKSFTLSKVTVTGTTRFTSTQITAASGLLIGQRLDVSSLDVAADRLFQTGALARVSYSFQTTGESLALEFQVADSTHFMPCTYDNFVWFSDSDLNAAVRREVPLFDGTVAEGGMMLSQVTSVLESFLREHNIDRTVGARLASNVAGKVTGFTFSVSEINIPILKVDLTGGPLSAAATANSIRPLRLANYSRSFAQNVAQTGIVESYKNEGYLQVQISDPQITMKDPMASDALQGVSVVFTVTPGPLYNWNDVDWSGNQVIASLELNRLVGMKKGEIARYDRISAGWEAILQAYGNVGYLELNLLPTANFDPSQHLVHFQVSVQEGGQYTMGELHVTGASGALASNIQIAWKLKPGQVYNLSYEKTFLKEDIQRAMRSSSGMKTALQTTMTRTLNKQTHTVNVELQFH